MWIVLNPTKAHRFTTKGINLHKGAPTAFVPPELENEYRAIIERAIVDGRLIRVTGNTLKGMIIPNQAKIEDISHEDTDMTVGVKYETNEDGVRVTTITMPDRDGEISKSEKPKQGGVIITPISWSERDEDEDEEVV